MNLLLIISYSYYWRNLISKEEVMGSSFAGYFQSLCLCLADQLYVFAEGYMTHMYVFVMQQCKH